MLNTPYQRTSLIATRLLIENFLVFAFQYAGLSLSFVQQVLPLQLAMGSALAFIFLRGYSVLVGIFCGSVFTLLMAHVSFCQAFLWSCIFSLQITLLYKLSYHFRIPSLLFYQKKSLCLFLMLLTVSCAVGTFMLNLIVTQPMFQPALRGMSHVMLADSTHSASLSPTWHVFNYQYWTMWLGSINGVMIIAFAIIAWDALVPEIDQMKIKKHLVVLHAILALMMGLLLSFSPSFAVRSLVGVAGLVASSAAITCYMAYRYGWFSAVFAVFLMGIILNFGAYILVQSAPLLLYQLVLLLLAAVTLMVGAHARIYQSSAPP